MSADSCDLRADLGYDRVTESVPARGVLLDTVLQVLPQALASLAAGGAAAGTADRAGPVVWLAAAGVAGLVGVDLAVTRRGRRVASHHFVNRLLMLSGAGLLGASSLAWLTATEVRWAGLVVLAAASVLAVSVPFARVARGPRRMLLIGGRAGASSLIVDWAHSANVDIRGVCLPDLLAEPIRPIATVPVLGSLEHVAALVSALGIDEVVVIPGALIGSRDVRAIGWALEGTAARLSVAPGLEGVVARRTAPRVLGHRLMISIDPGRRSVAATWLKGVLDRSVAAVLLVVLSPVLLVVAVVVRRDSSGPALFRQTRVGMDGEHFTIYKFRTMVVGAEAQLEGLLARDQGAGPMFKLAVDPRTTAVGRVLRSFSIDELPQLVNVLRGEMSLVGPRPALPVETDSYDEWVLRRLRAKPGMTGAWQVGGRSRLSWHESVHLDLDYVDNSTLRDDLAIAAKTAGVVIRGGAS